MGRSLPPTGRHAIKTAGDCGRCRWGIETGKRLQCKPERPASTKSRVPLKPHGLTGGGGGKELSTRNRAPKGGGGGLKPGGKKKGLLKGQGQNGLLKKKTHGTRLTGPRKERGREGTIRPQSLWGWKLGNTELLKKIKHKQKM